MLIGELSWGCAGIAVSIVGNTLGAAPVLLAGSDAQQREWLPPLLEEPILCSFALTEPDAGSDAARIRRCRARRRQTCSTARRCSSRIAGHAAWSVVFASTDRSQGQVRLSAFHRPDGWPTG